MSTIRDRYRGQRDNFRDYRCAPFFRREKRGGRLCILFLSSAGAIAPFSRAILCHFVPKITHNGRQRDLEERPPPVAEKRPLKCKLEAYSLCNYLSPGNGYFSLDKHESRRIRRPSLSPSTFLVGKKGKLFAIYPPIDTNSISEKLWNGNRRRSGRGRARYLRNV